MEEGGARPSTRERARVRERADSVTREAESCREIAERMMRETADGSPEGGSTGRESQLRRGRERERERVRERQAREEIQTVITGESGRTARQQRMREIASGTLFTENEDILKLLEEEEMAYKEIARERRADKEREAKQTQEDRTQRAAAQGGASGETPHSSSYHTSQSTSHNHSHKQYSTPHPTMPPLHHTSHTSPNTLPTLHNLPHREGGRERKRLREKDRTLLGTAGCCKIPRKKGGQLEAQTAEEMQVDWVDGMCIAQEEPSGAALQRDFGSWARHMQSKDKIRQQAPAGWRATAGGKWYRRDNLGKVCIYLDLFAGTQSAMLAAETMGMVYIPIDIKSPVWSAALGREVSNYELDLSEIDPKVLWEQVKVWAAEQTGLEKEEFCLAMVWMSPCCNTFTPVDARNKHMLVKSKLHPDGIYMNCGYRDHTQEDKPPLQGKKTKHGKMAREADACIMSLIRFIHWAVAVHGAEWVMENPVGSLKAQWYMQEVDIQDANFQTVDYCVWGHYYHKPTNLWTSLMGWKPSGPSRTGSIFDGRCHGDCLVGSYETKASGRVEYVHFSGIGEGSAKIKGGKGRLSAKGAIPSGLHMEIVGAWMALQREA